MPDKLGEIFRSGEVLIVGSKIREDLERYFVGISPSDILDTRDLFSYALHSKRFFDVEPGMRAKSGLAVQAFSLYGSIVSWHKPLKRREDFEYLFGEMKNTVGPQKWSEMGSVPERCSPPLMAMSLASWGTHVQSQATAQRTLVQ